MNYRDFIQKIIYVIINPLIKGMIKIGITPNIVTTIGFIINVAAAGLFVWTAKEYGHGLHTGMEPTSDSYYALVGWSGAIILFAGLFDMMDGRLARMGGMSSKFGALWDSTLDRYSELITLFGICILFIYANWFWMGIVTFLAMIGSVMVSYVRARAEGLGIGCKVGLMQRPERVVVTAVMAIITGLTSNLGWLAAGMTLIAILANITAFWRVAHCYKVLKKTEEN